MSSGYLLDTNVLSEPTRPRPNVALLTRLRRELPHCATAAPVWHELVFGVERLPRGRRRAGIEAALRGMVTHADFTLLPYDGLAAEIHGHERARLAAAGIQVPFVDGMIAAIARRHDRTLVTRNVADFEAFEALTVENWFE